VTQITTLCKSTVVGNQNYLCADPHGCKDEFCQADSLLLLSHVKEKPNLFGIQAEALSQSGQQVIDSQLRTFDKANPVYAAGLRAALKRLTKT
jgi:catalase